MKQKIIYLITIFMLLFTILLISFTIKLKIENLNLEKQIDKIDNSFKLISPSISWMQTEDFLVQQQLNNRNYGELKDLISKQINNYSNGFYGFYFEDLNTGASIGINEKSKFMPMSLFKIPVMMIVLKKVQEGEISFDKKIILNYNDIDNKFGDLASKGVGYKISVKDLIEIMIKESDNTASMALMNNFIEESDYIDLIGLVGVSPSSENIEISPKQYSNLFRSLYYSTYLRRSFSELALTLLSDTKYNSQLPAGIPDNIEISHKIGISIEAGYYHDCGIVYKPGNPYLICVMSEGVNQDEADVMISEISKIVYNFIKNVSL